MSGTRRRAPLASKAGLPELAQRLQVRLARTPTAVEWDVLAEVREEMGDLDGALTAARAAER